MRIKSDCQQLLSVGNWSQASAKCEACNLKLIKALNINDRVKLLTVNPTFTRNNNIKQCMLLCVIRFCNAFMCVCYVVLLCQLSDLLWAKLSQSHKCRHINLVVNNISLDILFSHYKIHCIPCAMVLFMMSFYLWFQ